MRGGFTLNHNRLMRQLNERQREMRAIRKRAGAAFERGDHDAVDRYQSDERRVSNIIAALLERGAARG